MLARLPVESPWWPGWLTHPLVFTLLQKLQGASVRWILKSTKFHTLCSYSLIILKHFHSLYKHNKSNSFILNFQEHKLHARHRGADLDFCFYFSGMVTVRETKHDGSLLLAVFSRSQNATKYSGYTGLWLQPFTTWFVKNRWFLPVEAQNYQDGGVNMWRRCLKPTAICVFECSHNNVMVSLLFLRWMRFITTSLWKSTSMWSWWGWSCWGMPRWRFTVHFCWFVLFLRWTGNTGKGRSSDRTELSFITHKVPSRVLKIMFNN